MGEMGETGKMRLRKRRERRGTGAKMAGRGTLASNSSKSALSTESIAARVKAWHERSRCPGLALCALASDDAP